MLPKIIGIDIDGVITDEGKLAQDNIWHNMLCEFTGEELQRDPDVYDMFAAYKVPENVLSAFLQAKLVDLYKQVKPQDGVKEALTDLIGRGFWVYLITARRPKYHQVTADWLQKNGIPYSELIYERNKAPLASSRNVQLFIEDYAENALDMLRYGIPVVLMNSFHNKWVNAQKGLYSADNWQDIRGIICNHFSLSSIDQTG